MGPADRKKLFGNIAFGQARNGYVVCGIDFMLESTELAKDPKDRDLHKGTPYVIVCKCDAEGNQVPVKMVRYLTIKAKVEGTDQTVDQKIPQEYKAMPNWSNLYEALDGMGGVQAYTVEEYCKKFKVAEEDKPETLKKKVPVDVK